MSSMSQKQVTILLAVIAVLLVGVIAVMVYQKQNSVPGVNPNATSQGTQPQADTNTGGGMPPGATNQAPPAEFDPATAPKVPEGQTPQEYVSEYYQLCETGDYSAAFVMLPTHMQAYYGSPEQFEQTLLSYGLGEYSVSDQVEDGDTITVIGSQKAQGMDFPYQWTFVKGEDGSWLAQSRQKAN